MESSGFGADIGFVYEFRPNHAAYRLDSNRQMKDRNKYKLKAGIALLDIGSLKYKSDPQRTGTYDIDITGTERLYLNELSDADIDDFNSFFQSKPEYFTPVGGAGGDYKVSLPSTVQLDVDYHLHRGFYASLAAQIPINKDEAFNSRYYSSFTLTPRYEGRAIGVYVPLNQNSLTGFNAGVSFRLGNMFIGSGSVLTAALDKSKQADVHIGLRFGGLQKNMQKKQDKKERKAQKRREKSEVEQQ